MSQLDSALYDAAVKAQVDGVRYATGVRNDLMKAMSKIEKELISRTAYHNPGRAIKVSNIAKRQKALMLEAKSVLNGLLVELQESFMNDLSSYGLIEFKRVSSLVNGILGIEYIDKVPSITALKRTINGLKFEGAGIRELFASEIDRAYKKFEHLVTQTIEEIKLGSLARPGLDKISTGLSEARGIIATTARGVNSVTETSVYAVLSNSRVLAYQQMTGIIKYYQQISTLDKGTTPLCRAYDRLLWDINFKPVGHEFPFGTGTPRHRLCRSLITVLTKTADEIPYLPSKQRAALGGPVPQHVTYNDWLKAQTDSVQEDVLGKTRAKLWRENKLSMADLIHQNGRPLRLDELERKLNN